MAEGEGNSTIERKRKQAKRGKLIRVEEGYRERWKVERLFAWLGQFRRLQVRHKRFWRCSRALCWRPSSSPASDGFEDEAT